MKLTQSYNSKKTWNLRRCLFEGSDFDLKFLAENGPKMRFSRFHCINVFWFFDWIYSSIKAYNRTKITVGGKLFLLKFLGQNGLNIKFFSLVKQQCMELFWFFAWSYSILKFFLVYPIFSSRAKSWVKYILAKLFFWDFFTKKTPKWAQN